MKGKYVVIVAGGKGKRMGNDIPKQFLPINGKPILMHTIEKFYEYDKEIGIILVLPEHNIDYWELLCAEYDFVISHTVIPGGQERFFSVKNALKHIPDGVLIAVHDAVRPFVSINTIEKAFSLSLQKKAVAPAINPNESIRLLENDIYKAFSREHTFLIQTPQCFHSEILKKAYQTDYTDKFTDDLSVVEMVLNISPYLFEGERENIKITTGSDLIFAEYLMDNANKF